MSALVLALAKRVRILGPPIRGVPWVILALTGVEVARFVLHAGAFRSFGRGVALLTAAVILDSLFWANVAWLWFWHITTWKWILQRWGGVRLAVYCLSIPPVAFGALVYVVSWGYYHRTGAFPDADVWHFSVTNGPHLWKYFRQAEPGVLFELGAIICCAVALTGILVAAEFARKHAIPTRGESFAARGLISIFMAANTIGLALWWSEQHKPRRDESALDVFLEPVPTLATVLRYELNPAFSLGLSCTDGPAPESDAEIAREALPLRIAPSSLPTRSRFGYPRNCVLIVVESLRCDVLNRLHQGKEIVPCLNQLSREGTVYTRCYSQSVHSDYADPCLVSSLYPLRSERQYFYRRHEGWPKLLVWDVLKPHGYATALISSQNEAWSNMDVFYDTGGLDHFFDARGRASADDSLRVDHAVRAGKDELAGKLDDHLTQRECVSWIRECQARGQANFVVVNFQTSHFPYRLPNGAAGPFQPGEIDFDASLYGYPVSRTPTVVNAYYNALRYVDDQIDAIIKELRRTSAADDTMVIVTGDHGEAFNEDGEVGHAQSLLETVCRVPLIVWCPGRVPASSDDYLVQAIDIPATIVGAMGFAVPEAFQGVDLSSDQRPPAHRRLVFQHARAGARGADGVVTSSGWKYVIKRGAETGELDFTRQDMRAGPDIAARFPEVAAILRSILIRWRSQQIAYHQQRRYYELFFAPRTPELTDDELRVLETATSVFLNANSH